MDNLIFTVSDLISIAVIAIPVAITFGILKYRQNVIERKVEKNEIRIEKIKETMYSKIDELVENTHKIQLDMKGLETGIQKTVIDSIGKLINKIK